MSHTTDRKESLAIQIRCPGDPSVGIPNRNFVFDTGLLAEDVDQELTSHLEHHLSKAFGEIYKRRAYVTFDPKL